jgi:hypothetical protein
LGGGTRPYRGGIGKGKERKSKEKGYKKNQGKENPLMANDSVKINMAIPTIAEKAINIHYKI